MQQFKRSDPPDGSLLLRFSRLSYSKFPTSLVGQHIEYRLRMYVLRRECHWVKGESRFSKADPSTFVQLDKKTKRQVPYCWSLNVQARSVNLIAIQLTSSSVEECDLSYEMLCREKAVLFVPRRSTPRDIAGPLFMKSSSTLSLMLGFVVAILTPMVQVLIATASSDRSKESRNTVLHDWAALRINMEDEHIECTAKGKWWTEHNIRKNRTKLEKASATSTLKQIWFGLFFR